MRTLKSASEIQMAESQLRFVHSQKKGIESKGASASEPCRMLLLTLRTKLDSRRANGGLDVPGVSVTFRRASIKGLPAD
jgi:hypothetical protein